MIRVKIETHIDGQSVIRKVNSDKFGQFAAAQWHRLYTKYVPWKSGHLATHVKYSPWKIEHTAPYAQFVYFRGAADSARASPGKHPRASSRWDQAAQAAQKPKLIHLMQKYVDSGRLNL